MKYEVCKEVKRTTHCKDCGTIIVSKDRARAYIQWDENVEYSCMKCYLNKLAKEGPKGSTVANPQPPQPLFGRPSCNM